MILDVNDIAIKITNKLMQDLNSKVGIRTNSEADIHAVGIVGSYYNVRRSIFESLSEVIKVFNSAHTYDPDTIAQLQNPKSFYQYQEQVLVVKLAEEVLEQEMHAVQSFCFNDSTRIRDEVSLAVIDAKKIKGTL